MAPGSIRYPASPTTAALVLIFGTALYTGQTSLAHAQQATIKRTDLAKADQSATEAGALWICLLYTSDAADE